MIFIFIGSQEFLVHWCVGPLNHWSIGPLVHWSIGPLAPWSIGPLVYWSMGLLVHLSNVKCQRPNVIKVRMLMHATVNWVSRTLFWPSFEWRPDLLLKAWSTFEGLDYFWRPGLLLFCRFEVSTLVKRPPPSRLPSAAQMAPDTKILEADMHC